MNVETILCPVDFSESSKAAVEYAGALARESDARLILLHVVENPLAYDTTFSGPAPTEKELEEAEQQFRTLSPALAEQRCEHRTVQGDPAPSIIRTAEEENADLIVVGTHGRTGLARLLMGSVAEEVVRKATCDVLVVRPAVGDPEPNPPEDAPAG